MKKVKDGDRYGNWTVIDTTNHGDRKALCRCDCGTEKRVYRHKLTSEQSTSCGCTRLRGAHWPQLEAHSPEVVAGAQFGWWTALTPPYHEPGRRDPVALCRCQCGTEKTVVVHALKSRRAKSCGCYRREGARIRALQQTTNT